MITITLDKCLHEMGLTMNKLAVESDTRPNTVNDIAKGKAQRIDFDTLNKLLLGLNKIAVTRGIERRFDISDIIQFTLSLEDLKTFEVAANNEIERLKGINDILNEKKIIIE